LADEVEAPGAVVTRHGIDETQPLDLAPIGGQILLESAHPLHAVPLYGGELVVEPSRCG
jgi:hypothetical protein